MYHFVTPADQVFRIPESARPLVSFDPGQKTKMFVPGKLRTELKLPGINIDPRSSHFLYRLHHEYTAQEWFEEVAKTGEAVCWTTREFVEKWVNKKMTTLLFVALERVRQNYTGPKEFEIIAGMPIKWAFYPESGKTSQEMIRRITKYGLSRAAGRVSIAEVAIINPNNPRSFSQI